jgi:16S rRNA (uracil1498-N3)-methyltransferase
MRIPRIYQPIDLSSNKVVQLDATAANHLLNVLRLRINDPVIIFNGQGGEYSARVVEIIKRDVFINVAEFHAIDRESPLQIHLAQGISRGEKMDFTIQKAVELGVTEITPIITERCGVKLSQARWDKRFERWQKIIISASEQCGRNTLPRLNKITRFADFITQTDAVQLKLILHPDAKQAIHDLQNDMHNLILFIGPEGGITTTEMQLAQTNNFIGIKLGSRTLRTETAGLAAIAILQAKCGDI